MIKNSIRLPITILLSVNIIFLLLVPNFHHHNHYNRHQNHAENCCSIELEISIGTFINQGHNFKAFSENDCPIEKFIDNFTSLSIISFKQITIYANKPHKYKHYKTLDIKYLFVKSTLQRAPPIYL